MMADRIKKKNINALGFLNKPIEYEKSFSRGLKVDLGTATFLFISGTASIDEKGKTYCPGNFQAQVERTYQTITALLKSEGADWHDIVRTRCYLKDMKYYEEFNEYRNRFYKKQKLDPFPASICVQATLCRPDFLVEIEATAILKNSKNKSK